MILKICRFCKKELKFENAHQFGAHARNCDCNPNKAESNKKGGISIKKNNELKNRQNVENYLNNPSKCKKCDVILSFENKNLKFCSKSCAASFNNKKREKIKYNLSEQGRINIINSLKKNCKNYDKSKKMQLEYFHNLKFCSICNKELSYENRNKKTCSSECYKELLSKIRIEKILEKGTNNFKTKCSTFNYKNVINFQCDSRLEQAAIIYLIDCFKADKIEKFKSIINFKEDTQNRRFNPDFFVIKDDKVFIVEVKMTWIKNSKHNYNRTIPLKKEALSIFCRNKGYEMIWLDFNYDKKFKEIYKNITKK